MTTERPRFKCGYAGATDYTYKGRQYVVRTCSMGTDFPWNTGVLESMKELTGTLRNDNCDYHHEFPPDEVCEFFKGYVPAKYSEDYKIIYKDGIAPQVVPDPLHPGGVVALWHRQCRDAWESFGEELHKLIDVMPYYDYRRIWEGVNWDSPQPTEADRQIVRDAMAEAAATELVTA